MKRNKIAPFLIESARLTPDGAFLFTHPDIGWVATSQSGHQIDVPELWSTDSESSRLIKVWLDKPTWFKPAEKWVPASPVYVGSRTQSGSTENFYAQKYGEESVSFYSEALEKLRIPTVHGHSFIEFEIKVTRAVTWREVIQAWGGISFTRKLGLSLAAAIARGDLLKHRPLKAEFLGWMHTLASPAFYAVNPCITKELVEDVVPRFFVDKGLVTEIIGREALLGELLLWHNYEQKKPAPTPVAELPAQGGRRRIAVAALG